MRKKSLILGVCVAAALMVPIMAGTTIASLKAGTEEIVNSFDLGNVETEIEEGTDGFKNPMIKNVGENECLVRARVLISPAEAAENVELIYPEDSNWELKDEYYYYDKSLASGATTDAIFKSVKIKDGVDWESLGIEDFEVTVYQESVQTVVYVNGEAETDPDRIWEIYEAEIAEKTEQN